jgi:hypothetical protein
MEKNGVVKMIKIKFESQTGELRRRRRKQASICGIAELNEP